MGSGSRDLPGSGISDRIYGTRRCGHPLLVCAQKEVVSGLGYGAAAG